MKTALEILKHYWGYPAFRPAQAAIIESVLAGQDTLALLPTGGGKSVCFQVPALMTDGVCLVITPLIALMKDQVEELKRKNIRAAAIYSGMTKTEIDYTLDNFVYGDYKFLYLSPERLKTELLIERVKQMNVCLIAIDEAHCVSQWGHDFRPAYLSIPDIYQYAPKAKKVALTATATEAVRTDLLTQLQFQNAVIFQNSFARENLSFSGFNVPVKENKLLQIVQNVAGSGIVYAKSRRRTQEVAYFLQKHHITAAYYHAGLSNKERFAKQQDWLDGKIRIMVATNAFGMGINKPDVRFVVHLDMTSNLEGYYQEAGRAGRDGLKSYAIALYNDHEPEDFLTQVERRFVPNDFLRKVYEYLGNYYKLAEGVVTYESFSFNLHDFISLYGLNATDTHHALKLLEFQRFIALSDAYYSPSKIQILISAAELYNFYLKYPNSEKLFKTILRIYGGEMYSSYVKIAEYDIAKALFMSEFELRKKLNELSESGIIDYQPQKNEPQLTFLTKRYDAARLPLNQQELAAYKAAEMHATQSVISYLTDSHTCRMLQLQRYFSDNTAKKCGVCDNCLRNSKNFSAQLLVNYKEHLLEIVPVRAEDLANNPFFTDKNLLKVAISHLLENEALTVTEMGVLEKK